MPDTEAEPSPRGLPFPLRVDDRGGLALENGTDLLASSIAVILLTSVGERVMHPEFGCPVWGLLDGRADDDALASAATSVGDALARWEPRVEVHEIRLRPERDEAGLLVAVHIDIAFAARSTGGRRYLYLAQPLDPATIVLARPDERHFDPWISEGDPS